MTISAKLGINRRALLAGLAAMVISSASLLSGSATAQSPTTDPLPSWNDGPAKQAIIDFVKASTDQSGLNFVAPVARIATFDQDGTLWVEHPIYSQVIFTQALYDEAKKDGWVVISMKNDWKRIFGFDAGP